MFHHWMTWMKGFLQRHGKAAVFDEIWAGIPLYPNVYHCGKAYWQISQWSGKEMQNFGHIIYPVLAGALHDPLPRHRAVFQRALTCIRSLVYWSLVVEYQTHPTETLNYLADFLEEFHATKDVFTAYQTSKATDSIAFARRKDLKMQLNAKHAIEDEERAESGEALSRAQEEHRKAAHTKRLQEVYNSRAHKCTSFDFVKIHLMLHYEQPVQRVGHLVKDSTETQEWNHPKMYMGTYCRSNRNFQYERQILNDYLRIHVLRMGFLHLQHLAKEGHWTPEIQQALQLYWPKDQIVVTKCNHEQVPKPENLPLSFRQDEGNIHVRGLQSPRRKGFFLKNKRLPMYNFPPVEFIYRYDWYDCIIPTADRRSIGGMCATQFNLLECSGGQLPVLRQLWFHCP